MNCLCSLLFNCLAHGNLVLKQINFCFDELLENLLFFLDEDFDFLYLQVERLYLPLYFGFCFTGGAPLRFKFCKLHHRRLFRFEKPFVTSLQVAATGLVDRGIELFLLLYLLVINRLETGQKIFMKF